MDKKGAFGILGRYLFILTLGIFFFDRIYELFLPITIYPSFWILNIFYDVVLSGRDIIVGEASIEIINACVAGSAYFFLIALNFSIREKAKKRTKMVAFAILTFLVLNILRIVFLGVLFFEGNSFFDFAHITFWYLISVVFVVGIWIAETKIFGIKRIPFYSDIKKIKEISILKNKSFN